VIWLIGLAFGLFGITAIGAVILFDFATEQGFVGLAVYFACWFFMLPLMLIVCVIVGLLAAREVRSG